MPGCHGFREGMGRRTSECCKNVRDLLLRVLVIKSLRCERNGPPNVQEVQGSKALTKAMDFGGEAQSQYLLTGSVQLKDHQAFRRAVWIESFGPKHMFELAPDFDALFQQSFRTAAAECAATEGLQLDLADVLHDATMRVRCPLLTPGIRQLAGRRMLPWLVHGSAEAVCAPRSACCCAHALLKYLLVSLIRFLRCGTSAVPHVDSAPEAVMWLQVIYARVIGRTPSTAEIKPIIDNMRTFSNGLPALLLPSWLNPALSLFTDAKATLAELLMAEVATVRQRCAPLLLPAVLLISFSPAGTS